MKVRICVLLVLAVCICLTTTSAYALYYTGTGNSLPAYSDRYAGFEIKATSNRYIAVNTKEGYPNPGQLIGPSYLNWDVTLDPYYVVLNATIGKNSLRLYELENNWSDLYQNLTYLGERQIDEITHTAIQLTLNELSSSLFNYTKMSDTNSTYNFIMPDLQQQHEKYIKAARASLSESVLMGNIYEKMDVINVYTDGNNEYYEVFMSIAYENQTNLSSSDIAYLSWGDSKIPIGSYSALIRALIINDGQNKVYKWTITSITNKTPSVVIE